MSRISNDQLRVMLINPGFVYQNPFLQVTEPLGLLYIAAYIKQFSAYHVSVLDCLDTGVVTRIGRQSYRYGISNHRVLQIINETDPDVIGLTCMFSRKKNDFIACSKAIRKRFPNVFIVAGGTYPSLYPHEIIQSKWADFCIIGEGEESFLELLKQIESDAPDFSKIEGLAWMKDGECIVTEKKQYINNLDSIPLPARDLINYESYLVRKSILHGLGLRKSASILTSRSCPNRCNFCSMYRIHGPKWRGRSAENVLKEIEELVDRWGVEEIFIMDDNFTLRKERVLKICEGIRKRRLPIRWNTPNGISINALDWDILKAMKASGCRSICIAIETGDETLRNRVIGKRLSDKKIESIVKIASDLRIMVTAFYIIGMPGEDENSFRKTLAQIRKLPLNGVAAAFANPLPGTKLYSDCIRNNWKIINEDSSGNDFYRPYILTQDFLEDDLKLREKQFYNTFIRCHWRTLIKDTLLFRNLLLYPPFLLRIVMDRLLRSWVESKKTGRNRCETG